MLSGVSDATLLASNNSMSTGALAASTCTDGAISEPVDQ
jgi:hypothetical protein